MDAARKVKMVGLSLGLVGLLGGCLIVWLLMGQTQPREELSEAAKGSTWPALARYGSWEVQCRENRVQHRRECRLEASWSGKGRVHVHVADGAWNLTTVPSATTASLTVDGNPPTDAHCTALCTFPGDKSVALSQQAGTGRTLVVAAVSSSGQKSGGSIALSGFVDALAKARASAPVKAAR
jgi:invasion protein IalB